MSTIATIKQGQTISIAIALSEDYSGALEVGIYGTRKQDRILLRSGDESLTKVNARNYIATIPASTTKTLSTGTYSIELRAVDASGNGVVVRRDYIADPSAQGTSADTAIPFVSGIEVKPNTYYSYNGKTYVYMGAAMVATSWEDVSDNMAEWYE